MKRLLVGLLLISFCLEACQSDPPTVVMEDLATVYISGQVMYSPAGAGDAQTRTFSAEVVITDCGVTGPESVWVECPAYPVHWEDSFDDTRVAVDGVFRYDYQDRDVLGAVVASLTTPDMSVQVAKPHHENEAWDTYEVFPLDTTTGLTLESSDRTFVVDIQIQTYATGMP